MSSVAKTQFVLALRIQFEQCADPQAAVAAIQIKQPNADLCLQADRLVINTARDHCFRFGRHWSCDVFLGDASALAGGVGKEHLQFEIISHRCFVRDLATRNGTQINGKWLSRPSNRRGPNANQTPSGRKELKAGDVIRLPGITFTVVQALPDALSGPPTPVQPGRVAGTSPGVS